MSEKVWRTKTEGKDHVVGYTDGVESGEVFLDGNLVDSRDSSYMGVLVQMSFKIEGKPAKVRRLSLLSEDWELVYDGKVYKGEEQVFGECETTR